MSHFQHRSQKVLCLGFVRGNGITPLSLILLLYIYFLIITFIFVGCFFFLFLTSIILTYYLWTIFYLLPCYSCFIVSFLHLNVFPPWKRSVTSKRTQIHTRLVQRKAMADFSLITCPNGVSKEKTDVGGTALKGQTGQIKGK